MYFFIDAQVASVTLPGICTRYVHFSTMLCVHLIEIQKAVLGGRQPSISTGEDARLCVCAAQSLPVRDDRVSSRPCTRSVVMWDPLSWHCRCNDAYLV